MMEKMSWSFKMFKKWYFGIPGTKQHLEVIIALLTVLLISTTLIINFRTLLGGNAKPTPTSEPSSERIVVVTPDQNTNSQTPIPTANTATCQKGIGQISISDPAEGDTISASPVCISIDYNQGNYCSSVWQYRINGGMWSSFGNGSPCFYNIPSGSTTFELNVKSLVSSDTKHLVRTFVYQSSTPTGTQSAGLH